MRQEEEAVQLKTKINNAYIKSTLALIIDKRQENA